MINYNFFNTVDDGLGVESEEADEEALDAAQKELRSPLECGFEPVSDISFNHRVGCLYEGTLDLEKMNDFKY